MAVATGRRLVVADGQCLQTAAWDRGIGKYSTALLAGLLAAGGDRLDLRIVLSSALPHAERADDLRRAFPGVAVDVLDLRWSVAAHGEAAEHNRSVLDAHLAGLTSAGGDRTFLGLCQLVDTTLCVTPSDPAWRRLAVVYDLIPFMFHRLYLRTAESRTRYLSRVAEMLRADRFLAISRTVADDLTLRLGVAAERVDVLPGGPIAHRSAAPADVVPHDDDPPYVLMPTGNDPRKNNRVAILGFARFNARRGDRYRLRVTSHFEPHERADLGGLDPAVEFTGNVPGDRMDALYRGASALLFAPDYEGLGLPVLEAVGSGRPIACSDIAVFRELSTSAFSWFDPHSISGIADALERAVTTEVDRAEYARIAAHHTWERTTAALVAALGRARAPATAERPDVVVVSPSPGTSEWAGASAQLLHAELTRVASPRYVVGPGGGIDREPRPDLLSEAGPPPGPGAAPVLVHLDDTPEALPLALGNPADVLVLYTASLAHAWEAAVAAGTVPAARLDLERRLDDLAGGSGALLTSVVARARQVLVTGPEVAAALDRLTARLPVPPVVTAWSPPAPVPSHVPALGERRLPHVVATPPPPTLTDHERDDVRRSVACVLTTAGDSDPEVIALRRLGAVPAASVDDASDLVDHVDAWSVRSAQSLTELRRDRGADHAVAALLAALPLAH